MAYEVESRATTARPDRKAADLVLWPSSPTAPERRSRFAVTSLGREAGLEIDMSFSEAFPQVIITPAPVLIYPFELAGPPSTWYQLGDVLKLLETENPALMRQEEGE